MTRASVSIALQAARSPRSAGSLAILGLSAGPAVALGFARFAFGLLLPAMSAGLGWSYADAGVMNVANAGGYLAGALAAAPLAGWIGLRRAFLGSMAVTAAATLALGVPGDFAALFGLRLLTGLAGGPTFVLGAVLAARAGGSALAQPATQIAIYFGGAGFGIVVSALAVPALAAAGLGWRADWLALGALACVATLAARCMLRSAGDDPHPPTYRPCPTTALTPTFAAHALFGAGYIAYMTFVIALLRSEGASAGAAALFWAVLGGFSTIAGFFWGHALERLRNGWGAALVLGLMSLGAMLPLFGYQPSTALLSAAIFGASVMAMPSAVTVLVRRLLPAPVWTTTLGHMTVAFGAGQCVGPLLCGALSDSLAGLRLGLSTAPCILLIGAVVASLQREPRGIPPTTAKE